MDKEQFNYLIREKYWERLKKYIAFELENEEDIEEILQDTLLSAFDSLPAFSGNSSFFTWLCAIAKHERADFYRKRKIKTFLFSHLPWLENLAGEALGPEQLLLKKEFKKEVKQKVKACLEGLSEGYQEVLRLKYYQGLTVAEIASKLNESAKTIESRLFRARKAFAKVFLADTS